MSEYDDDADDEIRSLRAENAKLRAENEDCNGYVRDLESEVANLQSALEDAKKALTVHGKELGFASADSLDISGCPEEKVTLAEYRARVEGSKAAASAIFSSTK
jgi:predicted nuclease with TOPRIM domain